MTADQLKLFPDGDAMPTGLIYGTELLAIPEERALVEKFPALPFAPFEFHGYLGKRRVVSFGWRYRFDGSGLARAEPIPDFLLPLRNRAASFAGLEAGALEHALVTEYAPRAGIGWHKDRSVFGLTIGVSLLSACPIRFRRKIDGGWERKTLLAEPRSIYVLGGSSRAEWEHSIAPVASLRYSVTFRTIAHPV